MKKFEILDVDLVDFNTFEYRNGAKEFENEFKDYSISRLTFKFYNVEESLLAENRLEKLNLQYKKFFGIELEAGKEVNNHPAFFISFIPEFDVISKKENSVNLNKIGNKNFVNDVNEKLIIVSEKGKKFLEEEVPVLAFETLQSKKLNKNFYVVCIPKLQNPIVYKKKINLEKSQISDAYIIQSDGRVELEKEALEEVLKNKMSATHNFKINDQTYLSEHTQIIISGQLLKVLKEKFDLDIENITITPLTLDLV